MSLDSFLLLHDVKEYSIQDCLLGFHCFGSSDSKMLLERLGFDGDDSIFDTPFK